MTGTTPTRSTGAAAPVVANDSATALARAGADSVFSYVEREAKRVDDGVRWRVLSYENEMVDDAWGLHSGAAGIGLFLADYARLTGGAGGERARDLAFGALRWASSAAPASNPWWRFVGWGIEGSVGLAWLRLAEAADGAERRTECLAQAGALAGRQAALEPGQMGDFLYGQAGRGVSFLRHWSATGEERYLAAAWRAGEWLDDHAVRDDFGTSWWAGMDPSRRRRSLAFCHGIAGIGYFLVRLYEATRDERWAALVQEVAATLQRHAVPDHGGLNWPAIEREGAPLKCQWCIGAPGVGLFWTRAHEILGDPVSLQVAEAAGETTFAYGDVRDNPSQCHGLAGNAEIFVELYRVTRDPKWLDRARDFAGLAMRYRISTPDGDTWPADEPGYTSPDYAYGAAGVGHFFLRVLAPDQVRWALD